MVKKWGKAATGLTWFAMRKHMVTNATHAKPFAWRYRRIMSSMHSTKTKTIRSVLARATGRRLSCPMPRLKHDIATGYYRLGIWDDEPADPLQARYDVLDGIVYTTSQVVLGMSIGCARCHDHKRDPIPQRDYYRLLAFFQDVTNMNTKNTRFVSLATRPPCLRTTKSASIHADGNPPRTQSCKPVGPPICRRLGDYRRRTGTAFFRRRFERCRGSDFFILALTPAKTK